jgi:magnesium and cobalt transporter
MARPLQAAYCVLFPLVSAASAVAQGISRLTTGRYTHKNPFVTREELELLIKESHESGVLKSDEREMIEEIFDFGETSVKEVMVPLIDVIAAPASARARDLTALVAETGHSRFPIYRDRVDEIVGTVSATDLVGIAPETPLNEIIRTPYIVPESASIEDVLKELQTNRKHIAIVVDEYGGVSGLLTLEDIIEQIVGDIEDEYDKEEEDEWEKRRDSILVDGKMRIEEFNDEFGQEIGAQGVDTIAGFIVKKLGRIPRTGELLSQGNLTFRIIEATDRRIESVEIKIGDPARPDDE